VLTTATDSTIHLTSSLTLTRSAPSTLVTSTGSAPISSSEQGGSSTSSPGGPVYYPPPPSSATSKNSGVVTSIKSTSKSSAHTTAHSSSTHSISLIHTTSHSSSVHTTSLKSSTHPLPTPTYLPPPSYPYGSDGGDSGLDGNGSKGSDNDFDGEDWYDSTADDHDPEFDGQFKKHDGDSSSGGRKHHK